MRIFVVAFPRHRMQLVSLLHEPCVHTLSSFAFHQEHLIDRTWDAYWEFLELAKTGDLDAVRDHIARKMLDVLTMEDVDLVTHSYGRLGPLHVMFDSGAFTAWKRDREFNVDEYGEWVLQMIEKYRGRFASMNFISLDVIRDQDATWKNYKRLAQQMSVPVMPVVTIYDAKRKDIQRALDLSDYICFGSIFRGGDKKLRPYLDPAFNTVMRWAEKNGRMPKVHMLGVTHREWMLRRYPAFSSDSSTWCDVTRFGKSTHLRLFLPRIGKTDPASHQRLAQVHALRHELRRLRRTERTITHLWETRGVNFGKDS